MPQLSGLVAAGVGEALQDVLDRRLKEAIRQSQEKQHADQMALQRDQLAGVQQDREADNTRQSRMIDLAELKRKDALSAAQTDRNVGLDAANVLNMPGMSKEAQANELMQSSLRNPNSSAAPGMMKIIEGLTKIPPVDPIAQHRAMKQVDQEFEKPPKPEKVEKEWIMRGGKPVQIVKGSAVEGDAPYDATAQRNKPSDVPTEYQSERAQRTKDAVTSIKKKVGMFTTGAGSLLSALPGTDATNFAAELDTLKASIVQNELAQMRAASKTGGALGQVSDRENQLLSASLGALDPRQSPKNITEQLDKIYSSIDRWQKAHGIGNMTPSASHGSDVDAEIAAIRARRKKP